VAPEDPTSDRTLALGVQLVQAHEALRDRLERVRAALLAGEPGGEHTDLLAHCLGFCAALHTHHTGEDEGLLPALRRERPELGPVIDKLIEDHGLIAGILRRVDALASRAAVDPVGDMAPIVGELDGLAAIMSSHFRYEERSIGAALDALDAQGAGAWVAEVFTTGPSEV
jgi:hypothetical protein